MSQHRIDSQYFEPAVDDVDGSGWIILDPSFRRTKHRQPLQDRRIETPPATAQSQFDNPAPPLFRQDLGTSEWRGTLRSVRHPGVFISRAPANQSALPFECAVMSPAQVFSVLNSLYYLHVCAPGSTRVFFDRMNKLQQAFYGTVPDSTESTRLFNTICIQFYCFRFLCPDPLAFLSVLVPFDKDKAIDLHTWNNLCQIMRWPKKWNFTNPIVFSYFLRSRVKSVNSPGGCRCPILASLQSDWVDSRAIATLIEESADFFFIRADNVSEFAADRSSLHPGSLDDEGYHSAP